MELNTTIKVMLLSRREKQKELADAIGMKYSTLSGKLNGNKRFSIDELRDILAHFEVTPDELYTIFFAK